VFENIGDDEPASFLGPVHVDDAALPVIDLDLGQSHSCALLENGLVRCWGAGSEAQLGIPGEQDVGDDELPSEAPPIDLGEQAVKIAAGEHHTCAITVSDGLRCWGQNDFGQLGYGHTERIGDDEPPSAMPPVQLGERATQIAVGGTHACARLESGAVRCWGNGGNGRLGYGMAISVGDDEHPADLPAVDVGGSALLVTAGEGHSCAMLEDERVRCWGSSLRGQLGYGNEDTIGDDESPVAAGDVPYL
jgi:alpha-tubulin suppressor-like RCC1 family protein